MRWLILLLICGVAWAGDIESPPPQNDPSLYDYLKKVRNNLNNIPSTTTDPNTASRDGKVGDMVLFKDGNVFYLYVCSSASGDSWVGTLMEEL